MKKESGLRRKLNRVDYQVSLLILVIVTLAFLCVYFFNYNLAYNEMIYTLKERSDTIYKVLDNEFTREDFTSINTKEDINNAKYQEDKQILEYIKENTGVRYLYTAKLNDEGEFVYVLDGLSQNSPDFRYPGDLIEEETIVELEQAYQNEIVYPEDIIDTSWGKIFVSYYPIHEDGEVVGVIGIEFNAQHQYHTFQQIRIYTPLMGMGFAAVAVVFSIIFFRRISNPTYKSLANTDYLTGVRNRNAFELFMKNAESKDVYRNYGFISMDLNDLKKINDEYGHAKGDEYIRVSCDILKVFESDQCHLYRIGGDEFVFIIENTSEAEVNKRLRNILKDIEKYNEKFNENLSIASGCAFYNSGLDTSLNDILMRADQDMYDNKRIMKNEKSKKD